MPALTHYICVPRYTSGATEQNAATYMAEWVGGVKKHHNLTIDNVGIFNEQVRFPLLPPLAVVVVLLPPPPPLLPLLPPLLVPRA